MTTEVRQQIDAELKKAGISEVRSEMVVASAQQTEMRVSSVQKTEIASQGETSAIQCYSDNPPAGYQIRQLHDSPSGRRL